MKRLLTLFAVSVMGCNGASPDLSWLCLFGPDWRAGIRATAEEEGVDTGAPDRLASGDAGTLISGATDAGRLVLVYDGTPRSAQLPSVRESADGGPCLDSGDYAFLLQTSPGASTAIRDVAVTVTVTRLDGGMQIRCTQLSLIDAGTPLPDRDFIF